MCEGSSGFTTTCSFGLFAPLSGPVPNLAIVSSRRVAADFDCVSGAALPAALLTELGANPRGRFPLQAAGKLFEPQVLAFCWPLSRRISVSGP